MEQSSSPRTNPIELKDCIEELLRLTRESHIKKTLELDLGLSKDICFNLLRHNSNQYTSDSCVSGALPGGSKEGEWDKLMLDKGTELVNVLNAIDFDLDVQEPYFTHLKGSCMRVYDQGGASAVLRSSECLQWNSTTQTHVANAHNWHFSSIQERRNDQEDRVYCILCQEKKQQKPVTLELWQFLMDI